MLKFMLLLLMKMMKMMKMMDDDGDRCIAYELWLAMCLLDMNQSPERFPPSSPMATHPMPPVHSQSCFFSVDCVHYMKGSLLRGGIVYSQKSPCDAMVAVPLFRLNQGCHFSGYASS